MDDAEVRQEVEALETRLAALSPDAAPTIEALMRLYGEALSRMVAAAAEAPEVSAAFTSDELIGTILSLHGIRPQNAQVRSAPERCELCGETLSEAHAHLFDASERTLLCACAVCALLFPARSDANGRYRFIPSTAVALEQFDFDEMTWSAFDIPVRIAYFVRTSDGGRVVAYYPSPAGAVESLLPLDAWQEIEERNPVLRDLIPETQALLVNAAQGSARAWIVSIDVCYRLIALLRSNWRGLRGGAALNGELARFFDELAAGSQTHRMGEHHAVKGAL